MALFGSLEPRRVPGHENMAVALAKKKTEQASVKLPTIEHLIS